MSKLNLRAAFALGLDSPISAQQVFADRVSEIAAFDKSLAALAAQMEAAPVSPVVDRRLPRQNVLVYYGVGGIGKTTLSNELERRFLAADRAGRAAVRIDFAESPAHEVESYVLRLRAGLGHLASRWPAFDLALSVYWERAHPGRPLQEFINGDSLLRRTARAIGLSEQIAATVGDVIGGALPGVTDAAHRLGSLLYGRAIEAIVNHRTLRQCELLAELLEADPDIDTLSYFPYLLAWDLDRLGPPHPRAAVFWDTFENAGGRHARELERLLQRSVFLMPNVLFVITGRNRVDWADLTGVDELDFTGPDRWPHLYPGNRTTEPRQHLVGFLSEADAHDYLCTAMVKDSAPVMAPEIRERIVAAGKGLPLYLDLAVTMYLDLLARGRTPTAMDFGQPLRTIAARVLRDLDEDERALLRTAALLDTFTLDLLRVGCPQVSDAAVRRFADRPFLELEPERIWPYTLHQVLREALREADVDLADSWSERERAQVADRLTVHLAGIAATAATNGDRSTELAAFQQALALTAFTETFPVWLVEVAQRFLVSGHWNYFPDVPHPADGAAYAMLLGLRGARERRAGRLQEAIAATEQALSREGLPEELRHFLLLHHAHALRVAGRYTEAAHHYNVLTGSANGMAAEAGYWLADHSFLTGRFTAALTALEALPAPSAELQGEILRLRGHIYRVNALFAQAEATYRQALALARDTVNIAAEGKALTDLIQTLAWQRPAEALDLLSAARQINEGISNRIELVKLHAAAAVALLKQGEYARAEHEISHGLELTARTGYPGGEVWCHTARALAGALGGDTEQHMTACARLAQITTELGGNRFWCQIATWWVPGSADVTADGIEWLDGSQAARRRWAAVGPETGGWW